MFSWKSTLQEWLLPYFDQKGTRMCKVVWEIINIAVLIEVGLVINFCLSFHKNKKILSYSQAEIWSQGKLAHAALCVCTQPSMLINILRVCVCVWNAG